MVSALSPVSHKGSHQGSKQTPTHLLLIQHKSHKTAKFVKIHVVDFDTNMKQNIQTSNTKFQKICRCQSDIESILICKCKQLYNPWMHKPATCRFHIDMEKERRRKTKQETNRDTHYLYKSNTYEFNTETQQQMRNRVYTNMH